MFKYLYLLLLLVFLLFSCSDTEPLNFNYSDFNNTIGLMVEPSNTLLFKDENSGDVLKFHLHFSTEHLTPLGIDSKTGDVFENTPPFNASDCLQEVAELGYCTLSIKMLDNATSGAKGSISLLFIYNDDMGENINKVKTHQLHFEYTN